MRPLQHLAFATIGKVLDVLLAHAPWKINGHEIFSLSTENTLVFTAVPFPAPSVTALHSGIQEI